MFYYHILLVEDDEVDQHIFSTVLHSVQPNIKCSILDDALEALYVLSTRQVPADLIFVDVGLAGMSGMEFLEELKKSENLRDIPVIMMSGMANIEDMSSAKRLGAKDYIVKPGKFSELKTILCSILSTNN